ncbi:MAG: alanine--tRNA ligase-related protein, partial [Actinomycetes bacterium]
LLWPVVERLQELSGRDYEKERLAMRVIADHLRGATFLAVDGVRPSNKTQGYVLRRLVRRAVRFAVDLGIEDNFFPHVVPTVAAVYARHYPEVAAAADRVVAVLAREEDVFRRTLRRGLDRLESHRGTVVSGADLFVLYDTYGFPVELSTEVAVAEDIALSPQWRQEFDDHMAAQRERSRSVSRSPRRTLP